MSATAQCMRSKIMSKHKSFLHTKRILAIAVSSITNLRQLFPDDSFAERKVDDMKVRILKKDDRTKQLIDWMAGVYDALEKECLKKVLLAISYKCHETGRDILETYTFTFSYTGDEIATDVEMNKDGRPTKSTPITSEDTKRSAQRFLRNVFAIVSSFEPIKSSFSVTMRLTYYDDRRPLEYQPPGFEAATDDEFGMGEELSATNIGSMHASHHTMRLMIKTNLTNKGISLQQNKNQVQMHVPCQTPSENVASPVQLPPDPSPAEQNSQPVTQTPNTQGFGVRCPCGYNEDDGSMLICVSCKYWQHAICFCVTDDLGHLDNHVCNICCDPNSPDLYPTDVTLLDLNEEQLRETCMWRRTLRACYDTSRLNVTSLSCRLSCSKVLSKAIVTKLIKEGIAKPVKGQRSLKDIDRARLDVVLYRDIKKLALDMRKQAMEAKACVSLKGTEVMKKMTDALDNSDETPMKINSASAVRNCCAKRRLGIDSQEGVFQPPAVPAKSKKSMRSK